jgi:hypothetical protein
MDHAGQGELSSQLPPGVKPDVVGAIWLDLQRELAALSSRSTWEVFDQFTHTSLLGPRGAPHVARVIRKMVEAVRS